MIIKSPPLMNENDYQDYIDIYKGSVVATTMPRPTHYPAIMIIDFYMGFVYLTDFAQEEKEHCEIDWMGD